MARKRARRHEGAGSITKYQTAQGHRWQAKLPHGLTDPETGRASRDDAQAWLDATIPAARPRGLYPHLRLWFDLGLTTSTNSAT